jgi:ABC-type uncharacterized transport system substrate-binding protein
VRRRNLLALFTGSALLWPPVSPSAGRLWRIGLLGDSPEYFWDALKRGLADRGYLEKRDFTCEYARAEGEYARFPSLARQLIANGADVIVSAGTTATQAARAATRTVPIVMVVGSDPVETGLVSSLARPGGNLSGVSTASVLLTPKRLQLVRETSPATGTIAAIANATSANFPRATREVEDAARTLGLSLRVHGVNGPEELAPVLAAIRADGIDWLIVLPSTMFFRVRKELAETAAAHKLSTIVPEREFVTAGGLMAYDASYADMYRIAAGQIDRIIKGAAPGELPVQQPTRFELVINLQTAKALGLTVPQSLLARADEVIE